MSSDASAATTSVSDEEIDQFCKEIFKIVDVDNSGYVDTTELKTLFNNIAQELGSEALSSKVVEDLLQQYDPDYTGEISYEMFKSMVTSVIFSQ